ncbi:MAG TPA: glycosyltransferase [Bacteroidales bacterium]|nr:glycosyltransferase [Bacteroidales bacterium]
MNDKQPLVSIISTAYNHEKYIRDCIDSVLCQTYNNWEMIIVDDGSTDNTFSIAQEYAKEDKRIQAFTQQNIGIFRLKESYNFALSKAKGKYIAILECDDIWLPKKLEWQIEAMEADEEVVLSWGKVTAVSADLSKDILTIPEIRVNQKIFNNNPVGFTLTKLLFENFIPALSVVVRKSALEQIGGFLQIENLPTIDKPTWMQLSLLGKFAFVNEFLGKWRVSPNQASKVHSVEMVNGIYQLSLQVFIENRTLLEKLKISEKQIHQHFQKRMIVNSCKSGNYRFAKFDFENARNDYWLTLKSYGLKKLQWKFRALVGIAKSTYHLKCRNKST